MPSLENVIGLQNKTKAKTGKVKKYWFENSQIGLEKNLFYRFHIPLTKFDSGLDYVEQPEDTEIVIEWLRIDLPDSNNLDSLKITSAEYEEAECSIYLGGAHNPCKIMKLDFIGISEDEYIIDCKLLVDFEKTGVGMKELYEFQTKILYCK